MRHGYLYQHNLAYNAISRVFPAICAINAAPVLEYKHLNSSAATQFGLASDITGFASASIIVFGESSVHCCKTSAFAACARYVQNRVALQNRCLVIATCLPVGNVNSAFAAS